MQDITVSDLEIMKHAPNYRRWLFDQVAPFLGSRILEIGAGIGNYTEFLLNRDVVVCVEIHVEAVSLLKTRFGSDSRIIIHHGDISDSTVRSLKVYRCDTAICFNVLEHVGDHLGALNNIAQILVPHGRLLLIVPALPFIFGTMDRALEHKRRYAASSLRSVLNQAGYQIERIWWMNMVGIAAWLLNGLILRRTEESVAQIAFYDRVIVPRLKILERIIRPPVGLSLVCIAKTVPIADVYVHPLETELQDYSC